VFEGAVAAGSAASSRGPRQFERKFWLRGMNSNSDELHQRVPLHLIHPSFGGLLRRRQVSILAQIYLAPAASGGKLKNLTVSRIPADLPAYQGLASQSTRFRSAQYPSSRGQKSRSDRAFCVDVYRCNDNPPSRALGTCETEQNPRAQVLLIKTAGPCRSSGTLG